MAGTKDTSKQALGLRVAPPVLEMVEELMGWVGAPSKNWVWETAIIRWHAEEKAKRGRDQALEQGKGADRG
jgi:hypothetical protein